MFLMNKNPIPRSLSLINRKFIKPQLCIPRNKTTEKNNEDYQYIQRSKLPMMHFQPSLPRLPIPELSKTCERYLKAQRPLLSSHELDKTESYVSEFLKTHGPTLQKELIHKDSKNRHTSYISSYWFDMYLRDRKPLPINYNPFLVFTPESDSKYNTQLVKATNLIISSARFMKSLRAKILEPEVYHLNPKKSDTKVFRTITGLLPSSLSWYGAYLFKAFPLDMSQYSNLFNSTRIPELEKDRIYQNTKARHVLLMRKGHFYTFDILDENGDIRPPKEIAAYVKYVLQDNIVDNEYPVGIFTTSERDQWAKARSHLIEIGNKSALEKIDSAAFVVALDDDAINDDYNKLLRKFLHDNGANRWFDKSFSLMLSKDGLAGVNFEHSWGDGVAVLRFFQDVKKDISKNPYFHPHEDHSVGSESFRCEKLEFILDAKAQTWIKKEQEKYQNWIKNLDLCYLMYDGFGKNECKSFGVSPDAIMQLAFQLALYSQEGRAVPTYESCSTAAFKHGRTETIRPCTLQTKAVCDTFTKSKSAITKAELKKMIIECSNAHNVLTKEAAMGQGFDRHLFALKKMWEETHSNKNFPTIFTDPAYEYLNHNILSTSTLSSPAVLAGGFGPVVQDGYGIGYMIQNEKLGAVVTSYRDQRNSSTYVESLKSAFNDIHQVFMST